MGNSLNKDIDGKKIKLLSNYDNEELNNKDDVYIVEGGFGSNKATTGTALFIKNIRTKKDYRICGYDKIEEVK